MIDFASLDFCGHYVLLSTNTITIIIITIIITITITITISSTTTNVKMRRGEVAKIMVQTQGLDVVLNLFATYANQIAVKIHTTNTHIPKRPLIRTSAHSDNDSDSDSDKDAAMRVIEDVEESIRLARVQLQHSTSKSNSLHNSDSDSDSDIYIPIWVRVLLLFFVIGYALYAFGVQDVRQSLGVSAKYNWQGRYIFKYMTVIMI